MTAIMEFQNYLQLETFRTKDSIEFHNTLKYIDHCQYISMYHEIPTLSLWVWKFLVADSSEMPRLHAMIWLKLWDHHSAMYHAAKPKSGNTKGWRYRLHRVQNSMTIVNQKVMCVCCFLY